MQTLRRIWLGPAVAAILACGDRSSVEQGSRVALAERLTGTWDVRFEVDRPPLLTEQDIRSLRVVEGQLAFLTNRSLDASYPQLATPTNYGTFDVDFSPFGFEARNRHRTPTAVAGWLSADSVEIILAPDENRTIVRMRGRSAGDTVAGVWDVSISRVGGGGGGFVMRRRRDR